MVASKRRRISAAEVEPLGFNRDRKIRGSLKESDVEAGGIQIGKTTAHEFYSAGDDAV
jgi:hypothetical protein